MICHPIVQTLQTAVTIVFSFVRTIIRTVCTWVTNTVTVLEEVCDSDWGIFNFLRDVVCFFVEVVRQVSRLICFTERIVEAIEVSITVYLHFVVSWICHLISWPIRGIAIALCHATGSQRLLFLVVNFVIMEDSLGNPSMTREGVNNLIASAQGVLDANNCNIQIVSLGTRSLTVPDDSIFNALTCNFEGIFTFAFQWLVRNALGNSLTVYINASFATALCGCHTPGTNFILVDNNCTGRTFVHEVLHSAGHWDHSNDPTNIMARASGNIISADQRCLLRTSRFINMQQPTRIFRGMVRI